MDMTIILILLALILAIIMLGDWSCCFATSERSMVEERLGRYVEESNHEI